MIVRTSMALTTNSLLYIMANIMTCVMQKLSILIKSKTGSNEKWVLAQDMTRTEITKNTHNPLLLTVTVHLITAIRLSILCYYGQSKSWYKYDHDTSNDSRCFVYQYFRVNKIISLISKLLFNIGMKVKRY